MVEPHPEVQAWRDELGMDYGCSITWSTTTWSPDANKTTGASRHLGDDELEALRRHLAEGLYSFFDRPRLSLRARPRARRDRGRQQGRGAEAMEFVVGCIPAREQETPQATLLVAPEHDLAHLGSRVATRKRLGTSSVAPVARWVMCTSRTRPSTKESVTVVVRWQRSIRSAASLTLHLRPRNRWTLPTAPGDGSCSTRPSGSSASRRS